MRYIFICQGLFVYRPKSIDKKDLINEIKNLSIEYKVIDLSEAVCCEHTGQELGELFAAIPVHVTGIDFSEAIAYKYKKLTNPETQIAGLVAELVKAFSMIPGWVKYFNLARNWEYDSLSADDFERIFTAFPLTVTELNLRSNRLIFEDHITKLASILETRTKLACLDLSCNYFRDRSLSDLENLLRALPGSLETLILSENFLGTIENDDKGHRLSRIFAAIPRSVKTLDISDNTLYHSTIEALGNAFAVLPSLDTLIVDENNLGSKLAALGVLLKRGSLKRLGLKKNELSKCDASAFSIIVESSITALDLSHNDFLKFSFEKDSVLKEENLKKIKKIFTKIAESKVQILNLSHNNTIKELDQVEKSYRLLLADKNHSLIFSSTYSDAIKKLDAFRTHFSRAQIEAVFDPLSRSSVVDLDLSDNNLGLFEPEELKRIIEMFALRMQRLNLGINITDLLMAEEEKIKTLQKEENIKKEELQAIQNKIKDNEGVISRYNKKTAEHQKELLNTKEQKIIKELQEIQEKLKVQEQEKNKKLSNYVAKMLPDAIPGSCIIIGLEGIEQYKVRQLTSDTLKVGDNKQLVRMTTTIAQATTAASATTAVAAALILGASHVQFFGAVSGSSAKEDEKAVATTPKRKYPG
jgi:hypothetical protein